MTASTSRLAYSDCFDLMDRAMDSRVGIRVPMRRKDSIIDNRGAAWQLRTRLHSARRIDRKDNTHIYEQGHPLYGRSRYDELCVRIYEENGTPYVYLEKRLIQEYQIEELSPSFIDADYQEVYAIDEAE